MNWTGDTVKMVKLRRRLKRSNDLMQDIKNREEQLSRGKENKRGSGLGCLWGFLLLVGAIVVVNLIAGAWLERRSPEEQREIREKYYRSDPDSDDHDAEPVLYTPLGGGWE